MSLPGFRIFQILTFEILNPDLKTHVPLACYSSATIIKLHFYIVQSQNK